MPQVSMQGWGSGLGGWVGLGRGGGTKAEPPKRKFTMPCAYSLDICWAAKAQEEFAVLTWTCRNSGWEKFGQKATANGTQQRSCSLNKYCMEPL